MAKLFVPACGDRLVLTRPWTFNLFLEHRNTTFAKSEKLINDDTSTYWNIYDDDRKLKKLPHTLPEGTILECDRVYIRAFNKTARSTDDDFDSITWRIIDKNGKAKKCSRFWAKLSDCNTIEFDLPQDANYKQRAVIADAAKATKPERYDTDMIRNALYLAVRSSYQSETKTAIQAAEKDVLLHFKDAVDREQVNYEAYIKGEERSRRKGGLGFLSPSTVPFRKMTEREFIDAFFTSHAQCKFVKRRDGTCERRMSHEICENDGTSYYSLSDKSCALSGLSYSVITDAADQMIVGIEICKERKTNT